MPVSAQTAGTWELITTGHSPYRIIDITSLKPKRTLKAANPPKDESLLNGILQVFGGTVIGQTRESRGQA